MSPLRALYEMLFTTLVDEGVWGANVYPDIAPAGTATPYCVFNVSGGGMEDVTTSRDNARFTVAVKVVADNMRLAQDGAAEVLYLLDGQGRQESGGLATHTAWLVTTVTADGVIHLVERWQGVEDIYHDGWQFDFVMEAINGNA